ncbi:MAG: hypothetical protein V4673_04590 [Pseudomonadota bacterium]
MEVTKADMCVLGGGAAALITNEIMRRNGVSCCIIAKSLLGNLAPIKVGINRISPVPIFVGYDSSLYDKLGFSSPSDEDFVTTDYSVISGIVRKEDIAPNSFAETVERTYQDAKKRLIITRKHLGRLPFDHDLPGLNRKVQAQHNPDRGANRRIGFIEGVSPYLQLMESAPMPHVIAEQPLRIDIARRCVTTSTRHIFYKQLISTIPLLDFLSLSKIPNTLQASSAGAQIYVFKAYNNNHRHSLIYDCDARSPVHRAYAPRGSFVIAQIAYEQWGAKDEVIATRIKELLDLEIEDVAVKKITINDCYPLALSDYPQRDRIMKTLENSGVTIFGRLGQWEYLDLEELDWERIECLH